jgi:osmoprotectant transport system permease protein
MKSANCFAAALVTLLGFFWSPTAFAVDTVIVGSKKFTESYVLGEIARLQLERDGFTVKHRQGIGATGIVWTALQRGDISLYPEYTGTITEEILKTTSGLSLESIREALAPQGIGMTDSLGFNNTYAIVMRRTKAEQLGIRTISDLRGHPGLRVSLSNEFLNRQDGWEPLSETYQLSQFRPRGIEHGIAYAAIAADQIDVTDAYSTDAGISRYDLLVLEDNRSFFPEYRAVFLHRLDIPPAALASLDRLTSSITESEMIRLNSIAEKTTKYTEAAASYFGDSRESIRARAETYPQRLARWTARHLYLVGISLAMAILVGLPLGIMAARGGTTGQVILGAVGVIQTIPSLALLAFLVPVLGISPNTAILALFLYSLLPIVRNTASGLQSIPNSLRESAAALGLTPSAQLTKVYLPLASRNILAGIKTSAVINVGTATIAALIGAGGLGEPIISGLSLNDNRTILEGAIPAALLALLVQWGFELMDRLVIPKGLRRPPAR